MFDFVRKHTKIMMFLMFLLIIPAFVLVGIDGFKGQGAGGATVAKVGSFSVKQDQWDATHKSEVDRVRSSQPNVDPKLLDSPEARYVTLERLVREHVLADAAADSHFASTDARLARELQQNPTIASLRKPDGTLDMERYRQLAAAQGLTPEGFEARVRKDLALRQVEGGITSTALAPAGQANVALNAFFERRELQVATFLPADYKAQVSPTDAEMEAYYQANQKQFQAPESATLEYVVLDLDSVKKSITVNEEELKSYYEQNVARLSGKEERRASHILINAPKDMPAADRAKAKEKAEALLAQVRKAPDSFADVARKNSQDGGSAPSGGDLDFFGRGAMVKPFEDAAFAMKKGDISDLVESDFGYHIIKLVDIKAPKQKTFEEVKPTIEADLRSQQAQRKYAELADTFTNAVYEQSDTYKSVAEKLKLEIKTASNVQRRPLPDAKGALANAKLLTAVFNPDSVEKKRNTEAIEIGPNQLVSARVTQYAPARVLPLNDVRTAVRDRLIATRSADLAKKDGAAKLQAWTAQPDAAKLAAAVVVSRDQQTQAVPPAVMDQAMHADTAKLPAWVGVDLGSQGYAVVRINKVMERNAPAEGQAKQERAQYAQWVASAENQAYYEVLKKRYKAQITVAKPVNGLNLPPVAE
ncbi:peptidylprolyl isomerase [Rhodoferax lacus]|uniref:Periplasmic chaperone PpiD n=1 Tax=Rhodoferax lacus TaxID=2184758 RepID=A0A3E1RHL2_9BURK|nr:SurA N-terminal domain-containing protein [Rhodoferax lacus]RFO98834.1 peptidylprolyl isomerase [Rhodoferax lacus]